MSTRPGTVAGHQTQTDPSTMCQQDLVQWQATRHRQTPVQCVNKTWYSGRPPDTDRPQYNVSTRPGTVAGHQTQTDPSKMCQQDLVQWQATRHRQTPVQCVNKTWYSGRPPDTDRPQYNVSTRPGTAVGKAPRPQTDPSTVSQQGQLGYAAKGSSIPD